MPFARYVDDGLFYCRSDSESIRLQQAICERFLNFHLELDPTKTKIFYSRDANRRGNHINIQFEFLGGAEVDWPRVDRGNTLIASVLQLVVYRPKVNMDVCDSGNSRDE